MASELIYSLAFIRWLVYYNVYMDNKGLKPICPERGINTDYSLYNSGDIIKMKQISYMDVLSGYLATISCAANITYKDLYVGIYDSMNALHRPKLASYNTSDYLRNLFLWSAETTDYEIFNFGDFHKSMYKAERKDIPIPLIINRTNIIPANPNLINDYVRYTIHLGYGHIIPSLFLCEVKETNYVSDITSFMTHISGDIEIITFGHGIHDVVGNDIVAESYVKPFFDRSFIEKIYNRNYGNVFSKLFDYSPEYKFLYDAYKVIESNIYALITENDVNEFKKMKIIRIPCIKRAFTNVIFMMTIIHNISHYYNYYTLIDTIPNKEFIYKIETLISACGLKKQIQKLDITHPLQIKIINELTLLYPEYKNILGSVLFMTPHKNMSNII
jgi:hypothetical protein